MSDFQPNLNQLNRVTESNVMVEILISVQAGIQIWGLLSSSQSLSPPYQTLLCSTSWSHPWQIYLFPQYVCIRANMTLGPCWVDDCCTIGVSCPHPLEFEGPMPEMSRIMSPWSNLMMGRFQTTLWGKCSIHLVFANAQSNFSITKFVPLAFVHPSERETF